jgi:hypothetical protein
LDRSFVLIDRQRGIGLSGLIGHIEPIFLVQLIASNGSFHFQLVTLDRALSCSISCIESIFLV